MIINWGYGARFQEQSAYVSGIDTYVWTGSYVVYVLESTAAFPGRIFTSGNKRHIFGAKNRKSFFPSSGI